MMQGILLIAIVLLAITVLAPTIYAGLIGAPLVFTPKDAIRKALKEVGVKKGQTFFDLGSGTGRSLIIAEKEFELQGTGFELSPVFYAFSKINLFLSSAKKSEVLLKNAYDQNMHPADVVFCFLSVDPMEKLKSKFEEELKIGSKVISYSFSIKDWKPEKVITGFPGNVYIYEIGKIK